MAKTVEGGCKCGLIRYQGTLADFPMFRCHCRDCQQLTGSGHADMVPLIAERFAATADPKISEMTGGSGRSTFSGFCPNCGSQLTRQSERGKERIYVHAGTLDDPSIYQPQKSIYTEGAPEWDGGVIDNV